MSMVGIVGEAHRFSAFQVRYRAKIFHSVPTTSQRGGKSVAPDLSLSPLVLVVVRWRRTFARKEKQLEAKMESQFILKHHGHVVADNQCSSALTRHINAPVDIVWSLVRRFDEPQKYKPFVSRCTATGELKIGSLREVNVKSGLPATTSTERLELLDDEEHIFGIRIVGGDHRLRNYSSVITVHPEISDGRPGTLVIESFVVDVPLGNTKEETIYFVDALINCNLKSLADVSERMAAHSQTVHQLNPIRCCQTPIC